MKDHLLEKVYNLILNGDLKMAISKSRELVEIESVRKELIKLEGRLSGVELDFNNGIIGYDQKTIEVNRIRNALFKILEKKPDPKENLNQSKVQIIIEGILDDRISNKLRDVSKVISSLLEIDENNVRLLRVDQGSIAMIFSIPEESRKILERLYNQNFHELSEKFSPLKLVQIIFEEGLFISNKEKISIDSTGIHFLDKKSGYEIYEITIENLDANYSVSFSINLENGIKQVDSALILDFKNVRFITSAGLGVLVSLFTQIRSEEKEFVIINSQPNIQKVFKLTGLDTILNLRESLYQAIEYYDSKFR